ncbi:hypothetical protein O181_122879 [Austropuccinia psidii MF-1]|uniref:Uncharacterized protein n=1 Tax=Austropuccinia psidii MF-1 TaxID=1389203 RepID=A0A9Q3KNY2_9BASI|nr:hypothetical protein [Austropuccinia psidii MF-1]
MNSTRSGSNYSIQSNGSGPQNSSHKSKRQECQPRGEAQMEDARTSTTSQSLANIFDTLIESPEAEITAIAVRPESLPTGSSRDIPVSVQELVYGSKQKEWELLPSLWIGTMSSYLQVKKFMGPEKTEELLKGWTPMSCKGQVQQIKAWLKNQSMLSEDQKKKLAQCKDNTPVETPQASTSKDPPQPVPDKPKQAPKTNKKGNQKAKGKAKPKLNKPYPQNYRIPKKEKIAMDNVFNMARTLMEFKKQGRGKIEPIFPKEIDLVRLVTQFESCNKEIMTNFKIFEYIQQKLDNEI